MEKRLKQSIIHKGKLLTVEEVEVMMPSGIRTTREIVHHPGAVAMVALNDKNELLLVRQYRTALKEEIWEIPAGKMEKGESPLKCAQRELQEETGYEAKSWKLLLSFYPSPGYSDEVIHIFLARNLTFKEQHAELDEEIQFGFFPFEDAQKMIFSSQPADGKTMMALLLLRAGVL